MSGDGIGTVAQPEAFSVTATATSEGVRLGLSGELDLNTAPQLEPALKRALSGRPARIVLDLEQLSFVDSCGLRALLAAQRACEQADCALTMIAGDSARRLFELTGVAERLPLAEQPPAWDEGRAEGRR